MSNELQTSKPANAYPFVLAFAQEGFPLITRDGKKVKFVAYEPELPVNERVIILHYGEHENYIMDHGEDGKINYAGDFNDGDVFMNGDPFKKSKF
jgi:hypothetical protein